MRTSVGRSGVTAYLMAATLLAVGVGQASAQSPRALLDESNADVAPTIPGAWDGFSPGWWNHGDARALIVAHEVTGPDAGSYEITRSSIGQEWNPGTHGAGLRMRFAPASLGWKDATLRVTYDIDADDDEEVTDTLEIPLHGLATDNPHGFAVVSGLDLGTTVQGEPVEGVIVLRNTAEIPVTVERLETFIGGVRVTVMQPSCDTTGPVAPGATCRVRFRMRTDDYGQRSGSIMVWPSYPFLSQKLQPTFDVEPNPAWPDEDAPKQLSVDPFRAVGVTFGRSRRITVRFSYGAVDERAVAGYTVKVRSPASASKRTILDQQPPFSDPLRPRSSAEATVRPKALVEMWFRARDAAGNQSYERYGGATVFRFADISKSAAEVSGGWRSSRSAGTAYGDSVLSTTKAGAWVSDRISGREFSLVARRTPASGMVEIWVDGRLVRTVDLHASKATRPRVVATFHTPDNELHRIRLVTKRSHGRTAAILDSWVVGN